MLLQAGGPKRCQNESGAIGIVPEDDPPDARPVDIDRVVLGPDEAVLHKNVPKRVDAVPVGPPGEDLDPANGGRVGRAVAVGLV